MPSQEKNLIEFGSFRVDTVQRLLFSNDQMVPLSPKAFDTLLVLVESQGRIVEKDELLSKIWPGTFVEEGSLARNVSTLRKALGESPDDQKYIQTIPKRGYRFVAPVTAIREEHAAVIEEQTPAEPVPIHRDPMRLRWIAATAVLLLGLICVFAWRTNLAGIGPRPRGGLAPPRIQSIAVLPLENLSHDPGQDYFCEGITDELITSLAQIHALKVISRTSVMRYKTTTKSLPEIARELSVDAVLEGSVQRQGNHMRISAKLIHAATDTHLWAKDYERDVSDILQLEGEVAHAIAQEIQIQVTPGESRRLTGGRKINPAAEEEYLLARYHEEKRNETDLKQAIQHFELAVQLDPNYAPAYAGLSLAWIRRGMWGAVGFRDAELPARSAALKAVELDPNLAEAHAVLAHLLMFYDSAWTSAEQEFHRAMELEPNSVYARSYYSGLCEALGRFPEAIAEGGRALALDPLSTRVEADYAMVLFRARRYNDAVQHFQRAIELDSQNYGAYIGLAEVYERTGKLQDALALIEQALRIRDASFLKSPALGRVYALLGRRADALKVLEKVTRPGSDPKWAGGISAIYFALGDRDKGFEWLAKAFDRRQLVMFVRVDPQFDSVRGDPRFEALVRRLGMPEAPKNSSW